MDAVEWLASVPREQFLEVVEENADYFRNPLTPIPELDLRGKNGRGYVAATEDATNNVIFLLSEKWVTVITVYKVIDEKKQGAASFEDMQWVLDHFEDLSEPAPPAVVPTPAPTS
ncbi:MAG: hypothetical protein WBD02_01310 [Acidimicrobiia bacterium]